VDSVVIVALVVGLALFFDFTNGFHDTANAMATPIATGALKPRVASLSPPLLSHIIIVSRSPCATSSARLPPASCEQSVMLLPWLVGSVLKLFSN